MNGIASAHRVFRPAPSVWSGFEGGLIGGGFGGIVVGAGYCLSVSPLGTFGELIPLISEIIAFSLFVGVATGGSTQFAIAAIRFMREAKGGESNLCNEATGSALAGLLGGLFVGALGGLWFGLRDYPPIQLPLLVGGSLLGSTALTGAIVLYTSGGRWPHLARSCASTLLFTVPLAVGAVLGLKALGINDKWFEGWTTAPAVLSGGALLGTVVGGLMGAQIGLSLLLYRRRFQASPE